MNTGDQQRVPALPNFQVNVGSTLTLGEGADIAIGSLGNGTAGGGTIAIGSTDPTSYLTIAGGTTTTSPAPSPAPGTLELANTSTTLTLTGSSNGGNIGTIVRAAAPSTRPRGPHWSMPAKSSAAEA